jgi:hypothetical protein
MARLQMRGEQYLLCQAVDDGMPNMSGRVARIIHGYADDVNRVRWKRY